MGVENLYIVNSSDSPVIDVTNSQKVSTGWKVRPLELVGRDWMVVVKAGNGTGPDSNCGAAGADSSDCDGKLSLVYAPNGNYPGPWF